MERIKDTGIVQGAKNFLRKLDEEHLAFERETPKGKQTLTFRQYIGLPLLKPWGPILDRLPVDKPDEEGVLTENSDNSP